MDAKASKPEESNLTDNMDLDPDTLDLATGIDNVGMDLKDLVESIYNDKHRIFEEGFPDSPPDSGSEHLLSPSHNVQQLSPNGIQFSEHKITMAHLDLSTIDYDVPLQILEQGISESVPVEVHQAAFNPQVVLPSSHGGPVQFSPQSTQLSLKNETLPTQAPVRKRRRQESQGISPTLSIKADPDGSNGAGQTASNIHFGMHQTEKWVCLLNKDRQEIKLPVMVVSADKGFNYSTVDEAFIAQKKNHFQLTCHIEMSSREQPFFIKGKNGTILPLDHLRMNFYGIKFDTPNTFIRVEQSQTDRSKIKFHPVRLELPDNNEPIRMSVGRLHFTETTANNMRKKGKPNPSQKYFQLVATLEAVAQSQRTLELPIVSMASERIIVRASNPGQFEPDGDGVWNRDQTGDAICHMGKVGINTDQVPEALSVHGNIQLTGQILQPSDLRIKEQVRQLDSKKQLQNVNRIQIVEYKYRPEFIEKLPDQQKSDYRAKSQTGVIAQEIQKVIPDAVSSSGPFTLSNGNEINDMLIVNKERLFLENIGAVRELSKMTDQLDDRLTEIEFAHESVAVRLSRLRKGNHSIHSYSSSVSSTRGKNSKKSHGSIFQNRYIQILILLLMSVTALSLTCMALVYVVNFSSNDSGDMEMEDVSFLNSSDIFSNKIEHWTTRALYKTTPILKYSKPTPSTTTNTRQTRLTPTSTFQPRTVLQPPVIGDDLCIRSGTECPTFCCGSSPAPTVNETEWDNSLTGPEIDEGLAVNNGVDLPRPDVLMVKLPEEQVMNLDIIENKDNTNEDEKPAETTTSFDIPKVHETNDKINDILEGAKRDKDLGSNELKDNKGLSLNATTALEVNNLKVQVLKLNTNMYVKNTFENDLNNEVLDKVKAASSPREVRLLKTPLVTDKKVDPLMAIERLVKEDGDLDLNETDQNQIDKADHYHPTPMNLTNRDLSKKGVVDTADQRAKRNVAGKRRLIRNVEGESASQAYPTLQTSRQIFTLDQQFCDPNDASFWDCQDFSGLQDNATLSVPVSKYFQEPLVQLVFDEGDYVRCSSPDGGQGCLPDEPVVVETLDMVPRRVFELDISKQRTPNFRFRQLLPGHRVTGSADLCTLSADQVGQIFREVNIGFYRVCHH